MQKKHLIFLFAAFAAAPVLAKPVVQEAQLLGKWQCAATDKTPMTFTFGSEQKVSVIVDLNIPSPDDETLVYRVFTDGTWTLNGEKIGEISQNYKNEDVVLKILRNNKEITENVKLTYSEKTKGNILGIHLLSQKSTFGERIKISFIMFGDYFKMTLDGVKMLVTGKVAMKEMTGPVGLPKVIGEAYGQGGLFAMLGVFILISINIGIMNLLPIPALDGGRLIFIIPEFFGIKINKKIEEKVHFIGMIFLLVLMLIIVFFDVTKYF